MAERKAPARKAAPKKVADPEPEPAATEPEQQGGFVGVVPDDTPNEHYTLPGVIAGLPVPEHDR